MIDVNGLPRIEWYRVPPEDFRKIIADSVYEDIPLPLSEDGDLVVTERDDIYILSAFSEHEFDQSKALYKKEGLYKYVDAVVRGYGCDR